MTQESEAQQSELDVRPLPPIDRHRLIFERCDHLAVGDAFVLVNDRGPKPLYYQLEAERAGQFTWTYLKSGPQVWHVRIQRQRAA
jgi:uncharacterized protein (DUF2249 family)